MAHCAGSRVVFFVLALLPSLAFAQVPNRLGYQARVLKADGSAQQGMTSLRFSIWDAAASGSELWSETQTLGLTDGFFSTYLGDASAGVPPSIFDGTERFLELEVNGSKLSPRQRIDSVAYAMTCRDLRGGSVSTSGPIVVGGNTVVDSSGKLMAAAFTPGPGIVVGDAGISLPTGCASGQVLAWLGNDWVCSTPASGGGGGIPDGGLPFSNLAQNGCAAGQSPTWNGSAWGCGQQELRQYTGVVLLKNAASCPSGWTAEPIGSLTGSDTNFYTSISAAGTFMGGLNYNSPTYSYLWSQTGATGGVTTVCHRQFNSIGKPVVHFIGAMGATACPGGYTQLSVANDLRGTNGWTYFQANAGGFFLGYIDAWGRGAQSFGDTYHYRDFGPVATYTAIEMTCFKVMGVEEDPPSRLGVYPVLLGVKGPAVCPAGYTYRSHADTKGSNDYSYASFTPNTIAFGAVRSWGYDGESSLNQWWTSASNVNYCWKLYPLTGAGKPAVNLRALNGQNCPAGWASMNVSDLNGANNTAYIHRSGAGLYMGGLLDWDQISRVDGVVSHYVTNTANRLCYQVTNVASFP